MTQSKLRRLFNEQVNEIRSFLRSTDFSKALILTLAIATPVTIFSQLDLLPIGVIIAMGSLLSSPSDVSGSFKHKLNSLLFASLLAGVTTIVIGYASGNTYVLVVAIAVLMFAISYLSVYGFRASLVTFSGLLAIVLSFAEIGKNVAIWERGLLISFGGVWYLLLSLGLYFIKPKQQTEQLLAECLMLTSDYLKIRAKLPLLKDRRAELKKQLLLLQNDLNDKHEVLRELLLSARKFSGNSNFSRRRMLVFIELVDILELAMSHPLNYEKIEDILVEEPEQLELISDLVMTMGVQLEKIAVSLNRNKPLPKNKIPNALKLVKDKLEEFRINVNINDNRESLIVLRNLFDYQEKQSQKINGIHRLLSNGRIKERNLHQEKDLANFITTQDYSWSKLVDNFNFNSPIFRHSLRLATVVVIGFIIGAIFSIQNAYWILLTIVVIMRPNYGLTISRIKQRIIGTLIGAGIALAIVIITQDKLVYASLGILSLTLAFALIQRNYKTAATFVTLSIVFIYALLQPDFLNVIEYRVFDTLVGASLAALGNYFLWPAWELQGINNIVGRSLKANKLYFKEVSQFYKNKGTLPMSYKLARKSAFIEMGNLSAAFQRMTQEPKSRQKNLSEIYTFIELNQTFLSATAALGTFFQNHKTTSASDNFEIFTSSILKNLDMAEAGLKRDSKESLTNNENLDRATNELQKNYKSLSAIRSEEVDAGKIEIDENLRVKLQEAHLIIGQLEWLSEISENLRKSLNKKLLLHHE